MTGVCVLTVALLMGLFALAGPAGAAEWVLLGETVWGRHYYDKASVIKGPRFVTVTFKHVYNAKMADEVAAVLPDARGAAYTLIYELIDCEEGFYRQNSVVYCDRNDRVIYDSALEKKKYRELAPRRIPLDTPIGWLAETLCEAE